jgi:hypothetical protein
VAIISEGTTGDSTRQGTWTHLQQVVDHSTHVREIRAVLELISDSQFQQPSGQVLTLTGTMPALVPQRFADEFFVPVQKGQQLDVQLSGAGQTDLDIVLVDDQGKKLLERRGTSDKEKATLVPSWTGYCRILVQNYGGGADRYLLTTRWTNPTSGQFVSHRRLERKTTDSFQFYYPAGKTAKMSIFGDGDTDLNITVRDPKGNILAQGNGPTDVEAVQWQTPVAGMYTIEVQNLGDIWNKYALMTD